MYIYIYKYMHPFFLSQPFETDIPTNDPNILNLTIL